MTYRLGIDLGGTKIEGILIDEQFQVIKRERVSTKREEGYEAILSRIVNTCLPASLATGIGSR